MAGNQGRKSNGARRKRDFCTSAWGVKPMSKIREEDFPDDPFAAFPQRATNYPPPRRSADAVRDRVAVSNSNDGPAAAGASPSSGRATLSAPWFPRLNRGVFLLLLSIVCAVAAAFVAADKFAQGLAGVATTNHPPPRSIVSSANPAGARQSPTAALPPAAPGAAEASALGISASGTAATEPASLLGASDRPRARNPAAPIVEPIGILRSAGLSPTSPPKRVGSKYVVLATDPHGMPVRAVVDAVHGRILSVRRMPPTNPPTSGAADRVRRPPLAAAPAALPPPQTPVQSVHQ
jgi:hypothetical protein